MSDREKLIELFNDCTVCQAEICSECPYDKEEGACLAAHVDYFISNGVTVQKWIPVSERLPQADKQVLVARNYRGRRYVEVGSICNGEACSYSDEYKIHPREHIVTHWMLLPDPPKECE